MSTQPTERPERPVRPVKDDSYVDMKTGLVSGHPDTSVMPGLKNAITTGHMTLSEKYQQRIAQFDEICDAARELFIQKNGPEHYADSIADTGVIGAVVSVVGITARLKRMVIARPDAGKSLRDELVEIVKDLLVYAAIVGMMIMDDNWKPE